MTLSDAYDAERFNEKVDEASRLIEGLKKGTISPEYVDRVVCDRQQQENAKRQKEEIEEKSKELSAEKELELKRKVAELKERYSRKQKAREKYSEYIESNPCSSTTDYKKWDMWYPSDDEDELLHGCTPNSAEFRAMEKDIDERHRRLVRQRQTAQREKEKGNQAYKKGQVTEAYRCYTTGLEAEKHNMELHSNASLMSIKMGSYLQAIEHCDKVLHIADAFHGNPNHPLCAKAFQRRAIAHKGLKNYGHAVEDLEKASQMEPKNHEAQALLEKYQNDLLELKKEQSLMKKVIQTKGKKSNFTRDFNSMEETLKELEKYLISRTKYECHPHPKGIGTTLPLTNAKDSYNHLAHKKMKQLKDVLDNDDKSQVYFGNLEGMNLLTDWLLALGPMVQVDQQLIQATLSCLSSALKNSTNLESFTTMSAFKKILKKYILDSNNNTNSTREDMLHFLQRVSTRKAGCTVLSANKTGPDSSNVLSKLIDWIRSDYQGEIVLGMSILTNCLENCGADSFKKCLEESGEKLFALMAKIMNSREYPELEACALLLSSLFSSDFMRRKIVKLKHLMQAFMNSTCNPDLPACCLLPCLVALAKCMNETSFRKEILGLYPRIIHVLTLALSDNNNGIVAAATLALARSAKEEKMLQEFRKASTVDSMAMLLSKLNTSHDNPNLNKSTTDGLILAFATLSTHGKDIIDELVKAGAIAGILQVLQCGPHEDSLSGNMSLLLSNIVTHSEYTHLLKSRKTISALINIAHKSHPTSRRNAAIALARLAHDQECLSIVRKLHGIDVIYNYVKP